MCTLFGFAKLYEINDNVLLFLRFRLFRYLFKLAIGIINVTSNTIECLIYYEIFVGQGKFLSYTKGMSLSYTKGKSLSYTKGKLLL